MSALDDLLALFPDNTSGQIGPDDMRTAVTAIWQHVLMTESRPYDITNSSGPANGKLYVVGGWATPTAIELHDNASDATATPWALYGPDVPIRINTNDGASVLRLTATGPADTSPGSYGRIPVTVREIIGPAPGNNAPLTVYTAKVA